MAALAAHIQEKKLIHFILHQGDEETAHKFAGEALKL